MGDALRRLFLSIGVALGLVSGQSDPSLVASLAHEGWAPGGEALVVSARVENAFAPGSRELVEAGTHVALRFSAQVESESKGTLHAEETRALWYDIRSGRYSVAFGGGKTASLVDPQAARALASESPAILLCKFSEAREGARVVVRAEIGIVDSRGAWHDAPVLWNYSAPRAVLTIGRTGGGGR